MLCEYYISENNILEIIKVHINFRNDVEVALFWTF